jgi:hypothetical protein
MNRLPQLSWIPALSPLVLLAVFALALFLDPWHQPEANIAPLHKAGVTVMLLALRGLFIFAFYLAVPLWCVLAVYPASRPPLEVAGQEIVFFIGGWLAFFLCAHAQPQLEHLFLGAP